MMLSMPSLLPAPALRPEQVRCVTIERPALDPAAARALLRVVEQAFDEGVRAIVVDLSSVTFLDSLGVSALAAAARKAPPGGQVVLAGLTGYAQTVARVTHLHELFAIYTTRNAAIAALTS
jgi:anti-sigma B factor antagonist